MGNTSQYEKEILRELEGIPPEQLKKILRIIQSVKDEFSVGKMDKQEKLSPDGKSLLPSLGEGVGEGPEDLADHHDKYLYNLRSVMNAQSKQIFVDPGLGAP